MAPPRRALRVKPILLYSTYKARPQTSWRSWGDIETQEQADAEVGRIGGELKKLKAKADFPVEFLPVAAIRGAGDVAGIADLAGADTILLYAAAGPQDTFNALTQTGKDIIFFVRSKSGPHYLWYEIVSPRYLRQHTDQLRAKGMDELDVVVDDQDEILWRLRALCGLHNALGTKMLAIGGPGAWSQPIQKVTERVVSQWRFDIQTVSYEELGKLIRQARADEATVALARRRADEYLKLPGTTLETKRQFVDNCFLLDQIFRTLMREAGCSAITVHHCMGTIMNVSETAACLTLTTLNDDGYLAFCESDFVVIPSGVLLAGIAGKPVFLHNPTWPHKQIITLAHCTAPRKMDGKHLEPARILTHFESDYGAAPKVEMRVGQKLTSIIPDFAAEFWQGLRSEIVENPFLPICRSQIEVKYGIESQKLAERLRGFHWMTCYDDYTKEVGYACRKVGIKWEVLTA
ncbi:MAG: sugar isomerase [Planctomycetes bacterium]|nr:sugar isomerase [Planctomycetota bacterium]